MYHSEQTLLKTFLEN